MKKLISILVAFAMLAGAVFAQDEGSWSVGGSGQIGARLNFVPMQSFQPGTLQWGHATTEANDRDDWDFNDDDVKGNLDVMYNIGGLSTGLGIGQKGVITAKLSYAGDNWNFNAEQGIDVLTGIGSYSSPGSLWGNFTFQALNGIFLEAAVEKETNPWQTTDYFGDVFSKNVTGTKNYLMVNVLPMDGLEIGFKLPNFFKIGGTDFVTDTLQNLVFGAKFSTGPVGVAFQFALKGQGTKWAKDGDYSAKDITVNDADLNSALYLGVEYQISDQMKAGLEFRGAFGGQKAVRDSGDPSKTEYNKFSIADAVGVQIGARFNYDDGPLGAQITIKFEDNDTGMSLVNKAVLDHNQTFKVEPQVYYNVVPEYLRVALEAGLTFYERPTLQQSADLKDYDNATYETRVDYMFQPGIYFNFLGTGIGNWWGFNTGIAVEYRVEGTFDEPAPQPKNYLQISFKWSF